MTDFQFDFTALYQAMENDEDLKNWAETLPAQIKQVLLERKHGDLQRWQDAVEGLPLLEPSLVNLNQDRVSVGAAADVDESIQDIIRQQLQGLSPWRKGPYEFFGVHVDTEWRSDWKWNRIREHITSLKGRRVLDVGGGNGYHAWRMRGEGAKFVINLDPSRLFLMQYLALTRYTGDQGVYFVPLGIDDVPRQLKAFDTVLSMGVLYHRRSPIDHIVHLRECLRSGGELVLETLVVDGDKNTVLLPEDRYAQMNNVWFIPSCEMLITWLQRAGMKDVRVVDVSTTEITEQRSTDWMTFQSLTDFLDPEDGNLTIEGYPAPRRAVLVARAP